MSYTFLLLLYTYVCRKLRHNCSTSRGSYAGTDETVACRDSAIDGIFTRGGDVGESSLALTVVPLDSKLAPN